MRVLITGSGGTLGRALIEAFTGCEIIAYDRGDLDIADSEAVRSALAVVRPDLCVNAAAHNAVDAIEGDQASAMAVNRDAVAYLADAAASVGAVFVHYSTDYVFDGRREEGYAENDAPNPVNAYGLSKLAGERALRDAAAGHHRWRWYLIRTSRLFGAPGSSVSAKRSFTDAILAKASVTDRIEVVDAEESSPTLASDLADATRQLTLAGTPSGIYHRTNHGSCTWYSFAREILRIAGWRGTLAPISAAAYRRAAQRPEHSVLLSTKLPPLRHWREALAAHLAATAVWRESRA